MNEKKGIDKLYGCSYFAINDPDLLKLKQEEEYEQKVEIPENEEREE